jgi:hypothetical protein
MTNPRVFYVYVLFDQNAIPRYIGKGKNGRLNHHLYDRVHRKPFVDETLAVIGDVPRIKLHENLSELNAYRIEQILIDTIGRHPNGPLINKTSKGSGPNSDKVRLWHQSKSKAERLAHMRPAIEASRKSLRRKESASRTIKIAFASITKEQFQESGRRLNASYTPEKRKAAQAKRLATLTPERRVEIGKKILAAKSPEMLSAIGRRRNEFITPEMRREIGRKRSAHVSPEQRAIAAERLRNSQTKEQLSANGKKGADSLSKEQRSEISRKRAVTLGPEKLRQIALKVVAARMKKKQEHLR